MGNAVLRPQNYLLELDGKPVGRIGNVAVGAIKAEVITSSGGFLEKRISQQTYDPTSFTCGAGMSRVFYDWVSNTFDRSYARKNGAVVGIDTDRKEIFRMDFQNALLESVVLSKLDSLSKDNSSITVKFQPEIVRYGKGGGKADVGNYLSPHPKTWNANNFALSIDGLEKECAAVTSVSALGVGQKIAADRFGESDRPIYEPTNAVYPSLVITLPSSSVGRFDDWFKSTASGQRGNDRNGSLKYLGPDAKSEFFSLEFSGLGITERSIKGGSDKSSNITISLYYESAKFKAGSSATL